MFEFDSEPFSEEFGLVGYESRYTIENTGSLLIYLFINAIRLAFFQVLSKRCNCCPNKLKKWAKNRIDGAIWSGSIDFFAELYLNLAFSLGINLSYFMFDSAGEGFNNIFMVLLTLIFFFVPPLKVLLLGK